MLVRIEQIFGLFEPDSYISAASVKMLQNHPYSEATVFPNRVLSWGTSDKWQGANPHIAGVIAAGLAALVIIGVS